MGGFVQLTEIGKEGLLYINPIHVSAVKQIIRVGLEKDDETGYCREVESGSRIFTSDDHYFEVVEPPSAVLRLLQNGLSVNQMISGGE